MPSQFQKKYQRRKILPGFPKTKKFKSKSDVDNYFSGDKIQCLLCGKWYKQINNYHLRLHDTNIDDYKEMFGLPWRRGLCSCKTSEKHRENTIDRISSGTLDIFTLAEKNRHKAHCAKRRPKQPYQIGVAIENLGDHIGSKQSQETIEKRMKHIRGKKQSKEHYEKRMQSLKETLKHKFRKPD